MRTVRLRIAARSVSPRVFKRMVAEVEPGTKHGDVVRIEDRDGVPVGAGFYNGRSEIAVRLLSRAPDARIDAGFVRARILSAVRLRRDVLGLDRVTDAYRIFHAEADGLPGLVVDRYGDRLSVEVSVLGVYLLMPEIKDALREAVGYRAIAVRDEPRIAKKEGFRVPRPPPGPEWRLTIREHRARFGVDLVGGHKTGFFLDQRDTPQAFAALCGGRRVLDLCCHAGGFGIHAALTGGAKSVRAVDLDEEAVALARANARRNDVDIEVVHADAFDELRRIGTGEVDAVALDPPKLVRSRGERSRGLKRYLDLNTLALKALSSGGIVLTCSCSGLVDEATFLETIRRASRSADRTLRILRLAGAAPDHPVCPEVPESRYLKTVLAEVV